MGKCILLVRVSTERQSFDAQEQELFQLALSDGYAESDIIPICEKESGIKLKEEERKGLNAMKELIESDSTGKAAVVCPPMASFIDPLRQNMIDPLRQNKNDP